MEQMKDDVIKEYMGASSKAHYLNSVSKVDESFNSAIQNLEESSGIKEIRCSNCNKMLGRVDGKYELKCPRCKEINTNK